VSRDILLYHSINPFWSRENLTYAPLRGHSTEYIDKVQNELLKVFNIDRADKAGIVNELRLAGDGFFRATYPGIS
jgi:hypothetical protein